MAVEEGTEALEAIVTTIMVDPDRGVTTDGTTMIPEVGDLLHFVGLGCSSVDCF